MAQADFTYKLLAALRDDVIRAAIKKIIEQYELEKYQEPIELLEKTKPVEGRD